MAKDETELLQNAKNVLALNDRGRWTIPHGNLYPHQWLWDSCFIAIGLRHLDVERAELELTSLLRGQWANGMMAHLIFSTHGQRPTQILEEGWTNPNAPSGIKTSGLTQPPMLAEAVWRVGQKLKIPERRSWFNKMLPHVIDFHNWLYAERDAGKGLVILIHPYESGTDNSPPLMQEVHKYAWPWWLTVSEKTHLIKAVSLIRRDIRYVDSNQRMSNAEGAAYFNLSYRLNRQGFDIKSISKKPKFAVEELTFNCIFIRANEILKKIAKTAGVDLPEKLLINMERSRAALEELWHEPSGQYLSRSMISGELIQEPSIACLMPLYAGCITKGRAEKLMKQLKERSQFHTDWPVPSVPQNSSFFNPIKYWQGPSWVNTNWLLIDGLERSGYQDEANQLKQNTLKMVADGDFVDYFNSLTGEPSGAKNFSWTAALTIDLLKT